MGVSKIAVSLSQIYSRILTETFVYLVSWHGQLMSAYTVCPPLLVGQTMTIKYRHQLTMPSNIVNKISCLMPSHQWLSVWGAVAPLSCDDRSNRKWGACNLVLLLTRSAIALHLLSSTFISLTFPPPSLTWQSTLGNFDLRLSTYIRSRESSSSWMQKSSSNWNAGIDFRHWFDFKLSWRGGLGTKGWSSLFGLDWVLRAQIKTYSFADLFGKIYTAC